MKSRRNQNLNSFLLPIMLHLLRLIWSLRKDIIDFNLKFQSQNSQIRLSFNNLLSMTSLILLLLKLKKEIALILACLLIQRRLLWDLRFLIWGWSVIVLEELLDSIFNILKEFFGLLMNFYLLNNKKNDWNNLFKIFKNLTIQLSLLLLNKLY